MFDLNQVSFFLWEIFYWNKKITNFFKSLLLFFRNLKNCFLWGNFLYRQISNYDPSPKSFLNKRGSEMGESEKKRSDLNEKSWVGINLKLLFGWELMSIGKLKKRYLLSKDNQELTLSLSRFFRNFVSFFVEFKEIQKEWIFLWKNFQK